VAARGGGRLCCCGKMVGRVGGGEEGEVGRGRWERGGEEEMVVEVGGGGGVG
jgi:hypothetical protein